MAVRTSLHGKAKITKQVKQLAKVLHKQEKTAIKSWEPSLTRSFVSFGKRIAERFSQTAVRRGAKYYRDGELKDNPPPVWDDIAVESMVVAWANRDFSVIANSYGGQYLDVARSTFEALDTIMGLGVNMTDYMQSAILKTAGKRMGLLDLHQQTKDAMFKALEEARAEGLGANAMADIIARTVAAGPWTTPEIRAQVIARTETKYAQNYSSLEAMRSNDNVTDVLVFDAQLGPTDEECELLNGQTVGLEDAMRLMESEHPNGTRSFAPVVG
jgi:hypothetical protein